MMRIPFLLLAALFLLAGLAGREVRAEPDPEEKRPKILTAQPIKPGPDDDELQKLLIARYNAAVDEMQHRFQEFIAGRGTMEIFGATAKRLVDAGAELNDKPAHQVKLREQLLELMQEIERINVARHEAGQLSGADLQAARYLRIDAEIQLLRAKRKANPPKP
jgi:hypothetical protein